MSPRRAHDNPARPAAALAAPAVGCPDRGKSAASPPPGLAVLSGDRGLLVARDAELRRLRRADPRAGLVAAAGWLSEADPGTEAFGWALRAYAHGLAETGAYPEALQYYERAEAIFASAGLEVEVARSAAGHVWALRYLGRYDEAVQLAIRSRRVLRRYGELLDVAKQANNLGTVYRRMGRLESARRAYLEALRGFRQFGDRAEEAAATTSLGNLLAELGRYDAAERAQRRAVRIYEQLQQAAQLARARLNLGLLLKRRGDYGRALVELRESRGLYARLELTQGIALADLDLAQTYLALNLQAEAAEAVQRASAGFHQLNLPFELGQALVWSAAIAGRLGARTEAVHSLARAVELFRQTGNRLWEAQATVLEANLHKAEPALLEAVSEAERRLMRLGARGRAVEARITRADLLRGMGRTEEAVRLYHGSLRRARQLGDDYAAYRGHAALADLLERQTPRQALRHYRQAMDAFEALRRRARADDLKVAFTSDKETLYERAVAAVLREPADQRRLTEALSYLERGRSLGLLEDLLALAERGSRRTVELGRRLRDARSSLAAAYERRDAERPPTPQTLGLIERLECETTELTRQLQIAMRGERQAAPFDLDRFRAALPARGAALLFYVLGDELTCFVLSQDRLRLHRQLASAAALRHLLQRLRFQLGKGVYGAAYLESNLAVLRRGMDRVLEELWHLTLGPLASDLDKLEQLVIIPHGHLHGLPLHAAFDGADYAVERWPVTYVPSARTFTACMEHPVSLPSRPLLVGPHDERLPWVSREVEAIASLFPRGEKLIGRRASVASLRRRAGRFDLLHLAAHGVFRADNPSFSALRLSDGWLSVADLAELSRDAALVTLSACETGVSAVAAGEELLGLTRAVLGGGAATVLASLWTVHDAATSTLMREFYQHWLAGATRSASLREAMLLARRRHDHPHFWAPFVLSGAI